MPVEIYDAVKELGFTLFEDRAEKTLKGHRVTVSAEWSSRNNQIFVRATLDPPLDLGLKMTRRMFAATDLTGLGIGAGMVTGSSDLDQEFDIKVDHEGRAMDLFTASFCQHLAAIHRASFDIELTDAGCLLTEPYGVGIDAAWIERASDRAAETVAKMEALRAGIRPAKALARLADRITKLAGARQWSQTSAPFGIQGAIEGRAIALWSSRLGADKHALHLDAPFETSLGLGLAIKREGLFTGLVTLLGGQDIKVGHAPFDRRFLVRASEREVERVRGMFTTTVCEPLLQLDAEIGPVHVSDAGIFVDPIAPDVDPDALARAIDVAHEARITVDRLWLHGGASGPYR